MVELADTLDLGSCAGNGVGVQVPPLGHHKSSAVSIEFRRAFSLPQGKQMASVFKNYSTFFGEIRRRYDTTGAIAPSGAGLAKALASFLKERGEEPVRVLEVGPGTGPATAKIVPMLKEGDQFDLVELNDNFVAMLNERFETEEDWKKVRQLSEIHEIPLQDFQADQPYDFVISGLPHTIFPADLVESIMTRYYELLKPGGTLSYFEYMGIRPARGIFDIGANRTRMRKINEIVRKNFKEYRVRRDNVFANIPPAWVHHMQKPTS